MENLISQQNVVVKISLGRNFLCGYFSRLPSLARTCHRLTFGKETETSTVTVNANGDITMWKKDRICYKRLTIFFLLYSGTSHD